MVFHLVEKSQQLPPRQVLSPASPLQRLYAQDIKIQQTPLSSEQKPVNLNTSDTSKTTSKDRRTTS